MAGAVAIGGGAPISVQSMTKTFTTDVSATLDQIKRLEAAGCEIVRIGIPDMESVRALEKIVPRAAAPIVADVHFDYRLALAACDTGIAKLRINPGNIGSRERIEQVVEKVKTLGIPIRIGVNAGSIEKDILEEYGHPTARAMVASAIRHVSLLEEMDFTDIVI